MLVRLYRPAFMFRLGLLIIAQVVFLFIALSLVFFVPAPFRSAEPSSKAARGILADIERSVSSFDADTATGGQAAALEEHALLALEGNRLFHSAVVYARRGHGLTRTYFFDSPDTGQSSERAVMAADSTQQIALVEFVESKPDGYLITAAGPDFGLVHYYRMTLPRSGPAVLVVQENADVIVAPRARLKSMLLILFLVSALVSLLIVYLLWTRFKEPLERLTRGIEKTAAGGQYVMMSPGEETEMSRLADGFNRMSETMRRDQGELEEAYEQLQGAHQALVQSEQFLTAVIDSSPFSVIVTDPQGRIVLFNRAAEQEFQCSAERATGSHIGGFLTLPVSAPNEATEVRGFETVCWRKDGEVFPAYMLTCPLRRSDQSVWAQLYLQRDIVESRGFQDMMVRLDRMATRGTMAGDIGHEINNFLAVLLGNIELLPRTIAKGDEPGIKKKLDVMKTNVEKIARFADGLMEGPQEESVFAAANMNQLIENVVAFVKFQNRFDGIDWIIQLHSELPSAEIDDSQIQQVLVNLLYNAAEAVGDIEGNRVLSITTSQTERLGSPSVRVDIKDNGPGVPKDKEPLLFRTRFTSKKRGHGIGLITCQRIIDGHNGWIGYSYAAGAQFSFELPVVHVVVPEQTTPAAVSAL